MMLCRPGVFRFARMLVEQEYHFFIDFKGNFYFDDPANTSASAFTYPNSIKDIKFIKMFYQNIRINPFSDSVLQYPFLSEFWGQTNYLRCAIAPVIFNRFEEDHLGYSFGQKSQFLIDKIQMDEHGIIWHPFKTLEGGIQLKGVFSNELIAQILPDIHQECGITKINWKGNLYEIQVQKSKERTCV